MDGIQELGQRIVQAARLAVAVHLYESVARHTAPDGAAGRVALQVLGRRVEAGGAGAHAADDDNGGLAGFAPEPTSRLGDLVTDDEWDGLMGRDGDVLRDEPDPGPDPSGR